MAIGANRPRENGTGLCYESSMVKMRLIAKDQGEVSEWKIAKMSHQG